MVKTYQKAAALLLALALIFVFPISASAAEMTEAKVPVTLTVVNTVSPISCTVPAALQNRCNPRHKSRCSAGQL